MTSKLYRPCYEYVSGGRGTRAFGPRSREQAVAQLKAWIEHAITEPVTKAILLTRAEHDPERPQRVAAKTAVWFQWIEEVT